jgi:hypothetical protein
MDLMPGMYAKDKNAVVKLLEGSSLLEDVLLEAIDNVSQDYAVKLCCTSFVFELYMLDPDFVSTCKKGLGGLMLKDSIMALLKMSTAEDDKVFRLTILG